MQLLDDVECDGRAGAGAVLCVAAVAGGDTVVALGAEASAVGGYAARERAAAEAGAVRIEGNAAGGTVAGYGVGNSDTLPCRERVGAQGDGADAGCDDREVLRGRAAAAVVGIAAVDGSDAIGAGGGEGGGIGGTARGNRAAAQQGAAVVKRYRAGGAAARYRGGEVDALAGAEVAAGRRTRQGQGGGRCSGNHNTLRDRKSVV